MNALIPNRFLFSFELSLVYRKHLPVLSGNLEGWTDSERLPWLGEIDGLRDFAEVWACWSEEGIAIACRVKDRKRSLRCEPERFRDGDNLRLCIDTRDARSSKRATRFCHQFYFLPTGGGANGKEPVAGQVKLERALEDAPIAPAGLLHVTSAVSKNGFVMEAIISAGAMNGFDPIEHPRIGLYYILEDTEFGQQYLTIGDDLNWYIDPSTWAIAALVR